MTESDERPTLNPGYVAFQRARALATAADGVDDATRRRAAARAARWDAVLAHLTAGTLAYGTTTPIPNVPAWATPEVVTGGFATGALRAGGPLLDHERALLARLPETPAPGDERHALNAWFLGDAGFAQLEAWLDTGCYAVDVPEEGALLTVAWLLREGDGDAATELVETIAPFFSRLRFYPVPADQPLRADTGVHQRTAGEVVADLASIAPHAGIIAQRAATTVWNPIHDRVVALTLETAVDRAPWSTFPDGWRERARALLAEYDACKAQFGPRARHEDPRLHYAPIRDLLRRAADTPSQITPGDVARAKHIVERYVARHGLPDAPAHAAARARQAADVAAPLFADIAAVVRERLRPYPPADGVDDLAPVLAPVGDAALPTPIRRRVEACRHASLATLVEDGAIPSAESLALLLPQATSGLRALAFPSSNLRRLYAGLYRAFRRRRSLLLLDLSRQVSLDALPWVTPLERRRARTSEAAAAGDALTEATRLALTAYPETILPNRLVRELSALAADAGLTLPLTEEVAADIFQGVFSDKFVRAAKDAAEFLAGSLYATYYALDAAAIRALPDPPARRPKLWTRATADNAAAEAFARLCAARAGGGSGSWSVAGNGRIIEQQQILTTHNLATLIRALDLRPTLAVESPALARRCFDTVCRTLTRTGERRHDRLIAGKVAAYAWRQMVFFLSLATPTEVDAFLRDADARRREVPGVRGERLDEALVGLRRAVAGQPPERPVLGWTTGSPWLLPDPTESVL